MVQKLGLVSSGSGPFIAEVQQVIETHEARQNRLVRLNVRFRNVSDQPVILAYAATTSSIIDNQGNQYYCRFGNTVDNSVTGMGMVENGKADTSFALKPGESRNATFQLMRRADRTVIGTSFTWNVTISQLQVLPNGQQVKTLREYSLNFPDMNASGGGLNSLQDLLKHK